jgi:hypothetical protein
METKSGIILLTIITTVIIGAILAYFYLPQGPPLPTFSPVKPQAQEIVPPAATGNVDDAASSFLEELTDEQSVLTEEESDTSLITTDSQEVSDFGQSINESDL